ncbi:MAG: ATP-binding protein [Prevotella sp.]|nr:ATP-binding protein [Prevotella sp.]
MKKEMTLQSNERLNLNVNQLTVAVRKPLLAVARYYSHVLERPVNVQQTLHLLNAQAAFFFTVFPADCALLLRGACAAWLIHALMQCKREL